MITHEMLYSIENDICKTGNLIDALELLVIEMDFPSDERGRRQHRALIGVKDALVTQFKSVHAAYNTSFTALCQGGAT